MAVGIISPGRRPEEEKRNPLDDILKVAQIAASGAGIYSSLKKSPEEDRAIKEAQVAVDAYDKLGSDAAPQLLKHLGIKDPFANGQNPLPSQILQNPTNPQAAGNQTINLLPKDVREANKKIAEIMFSKNSEGKDLKYNQQTKAIESIDRPLTPEEVRKKTKEELEINKLSGDISKGKPEEQAAAGYAAMMQQGENDFKKLTDAGFDPAAAASSARAALPEVFKSDDIKAYEQARRNFVAAILRKQSGAAISAKEYEEEGKKYFPQVGDGPKTIEQKAESRRLALQALKEQAGNAYSRLINSQRSEKSHLSEAPAGMSFEEFKVWKAGKK